MSDIVLGLVPVFLVIAAGVAMRRAGFPGDGFWAPAERLTYFVLLPALLVKNLADADLANLDIGPLLAAMVGTYLLVAVLLLAAAAAVGVRGASFATAFMGAIRFNTYAGLAAALSIHGTQGVVLFSVLIGVMIPLLNVMSVAVLVRHTRGGGVVAIVWHVARNPLVLACAGGVALNLAGIALPAVIGGVLEILARASLGIALLAVGAGLTLHGLRAKPGLLIGACAVKLLVFPLAVGGACSLAGIGGTERAVAILYATLPSSPQGYILARQMAGDGPLIAAIISLSTGLGVVTIPILLAALT
ncbi:MAG: AEC family transporter [Alphaproteobacteria bacterium]|nr:AEC family transporter [Alphaproteobacteria bacterium]